MHFKICFQKPQWIKGYKESVSQAISSFYESKDSYSPEPNYQRKFVNSHDNLSRQDVGNEGSNEIFHSEKIKSNIEQTSNKFEEESRSKLFKDDGFFSSLKLVGQVGALYIICEKEDGLIVIDQHAAHERINYEKFRKEYLDSGSIQAQELLIPEVLELSPKEMKLLEENKNYINKLGFIAESFGDNAVRLTSVPVLLNSQSVKELFIDLLNELDEFKEGKSINERFDLICATIACHKSVRANQILSEEKIYSLLKDLDKSEFPHSCPHGRPTAREITFNELEKMFRRI